MTLRRISLTGAAAVLLLFAPVVAACSSSTDSSPAVGTVPVVGTVPADEIRIGLEAPLSGSQQAVGIGMLDGAQFAAGELNAAGGIGGKTVVIVPIDDAADPDTGVAAATDAIAAGLSAVVGPYNSGVGSKTLPLYEQAGLVPLRLTSADNTQGLGFTLQPMTSQIAPVATSAIVEWAKADSVALIYDDTPGYTVDAGKAMTASLEAAGVDVKANIAVKSGQDSYTDAVAAATGSGASLVYVVTYYPEAGLIAQAMLASGTSAKCLADYGAYDSGYVAAAGAAAAAACPLVGVPAPDDFPGAQPRVDAFVAQFGRQPGTWAPYTYDSVKVLAVVATTAGGFEAVPLRNALATPTGFKGWTGSVAFDATTGNRVPAPVVVVSASEDGTLRLDQSWVTATSFTF